MLCDFLIIPFVEIEIRLGTYNGKTFDSNIDKRYFEKIQESLYSGSWNKIEELNTVEYIKDNIRLISNGSELKVVLKENVLNQTVCVKNMPFDFRFSINQEFKINNEVSKNECTVRSKNRKTFYSDNFKYDLTIVNQKTNNINILKHEIEIELLVTPETLRWTTKYINDFLECKIYDIINIVESIDRNEFKIKLY